MSGLRWKSTLSTLLVLITTAVIANTYSGPSYDLSWHSIDSGGGRSTGGAYELTVTIGQHDASGEMLGGAYTLRGGFMTLPAAIPCLADSDNSGAVNVTDLLALLGAWGVCSVPPAGCPSDINTDGLVNVTDLLALLGAWGLCP